MRGMVEYRLYFLNQSDHIMEFLAFEAADDGAAVVTARSRSRGRPVELWQRDRLVMRRGPDGIEQAIQPSHPVQEIRKCK